MKLTGFAIFFILVFSFCSHAVRDNNKDYWFLKTDPANPDSQGYVDINNNIKIPYGKYKFCFTDTFRTYAVVLIPENGFVAIDRHEKKLFSVYPFDNGPDYEVEGTIRILDGRKVGIADTSGKIIIPPVYDFTFGFDHGLALVNLGGNSVSMNPMDPDCEYHTWEGGKWGIADRSGKLLLPVDFDYVRDNKTGSIYLQNQNERFEVLKGEILRR
jgi:hypothetical protein